MYGRVLKPGKRLRRPVHQRVLTSDFLVNGHGKWSTAQQRSSIARGFIGIVGDRTVYTVDHLEQYVDNLLHVKAFDEASVMRYLSDVKNILIRYDCLVDTPLTVARLDLLYNESVSMARALDQAAESRALPLDIDQFDTLDARGKAVTALWMATGFRLATYVRIKPNHVTGLSMGLYGQPGLLIHSPAEKMLNQLGRKIFIFCACSRTTISKLCIFHSTGAPRLPVAAEELRTIAGVLGGTGHSARRTLASAMRALAVKERESTHFSHSEFCCHIGWATDQSLSTYSSLCTMSAVHSWIPHLRGVLDQFLKPRSRSTTGALTPFQLSPKEEMPSKKSEIIYILSEDAKKIWSNEVTLKGYRYQGIISAVDEPRTAAPDKRFMDIFLEMSNEVFAAVAVPKTKQPKPKKTPKAKAGVVALTTQGSSSEAEDADRTGPPLLLDAEVAIAKTDGIVTAGQVAKTDGIATNVEPPAKAAGNPMQADQVALPRGPLRHEEPAATEEDIEPTTSTGTPSPFVAGGTYFGLSRLAD